MMSKERDFTEMAIIGLVAVIFFGSWGTVNGGDKLCQ
jgi:hypothetical protein